jgi:hypothetical protein
MKSLIRTYIEPAIEDQIKVMAHKHNLSVSALAAELIYQGLNNQSAPPLEITAKALEEQLYLNYFTLTLLLKMQIDLNDEQYEKLKTTSREWAQKRLEVIHENTSK